MPNPAVDCARRYAGARPLAFAAQACKTCRRITNEDARWWEARVRKDWGVVDADPRKVPRVDTTLLHNIPGQVDAATLAPFRAGDTVKGNLWRKIYKDRLHVS